MANIKLEQEAFLKGKQIFELRDDEDCVRVSVKRRAALSEYKLPLGILAHDPSRHKRLDVTGLVLMILFSILTIAMFAAATHEPAFLIMVPFFIFFAVIGFYQFKKQSGDNWIFFNRTNGRPALVIWADNPQKESVDELCKNITNKVRSLEGKAVSQLGGSPSDELRKLDGLKKDGIISEIEFEEAKTRLLGSLESKGIGFK